MRSAHSLSFAFLLSLFFIAPMAGAQDCVVQELSVQGRLSHVAAFPTDGLVAVVDLPTDLGDVQVVRIDAQGEVRWRKLLATTDPLIGLTRPKLLARPDGGCVVYGITQYLISPGIFPRYFNYFIISLDPDGTVEWARYYTQASVWIYDDPACVLLPDGDIVMVNPRNPYGIELSRIGAMGEPVWSKRFTRGFPFGESGRLNLVSGPDDSITVCGYMGEIPFVIHVDGSGEPVWKHWFEPVVANQGVASAVARTADGGTLLYGQSGSVASGAFLLRLNEDGVIEEARSYPYYVLFDQLREMPNGDIVLSISRNGNMVMRTNASGDVLMAWNRQAMSGYQEELASIGNEDTLIVGLSGVGVPKVLRVANYQDLACAYSPITITSSPVPLPATTTSMNSEAVTLKSWLISLSDPPYLEICDPSVSIATTGTRPGFVTQVSGSVVNMSWVTPGPATISLTVDPSLVYQSAIPAPDQVMANVLTWNAVELGQLGTAAVNASFLVPATTPLGTLLTSTITVTQDSTEVTLDNNTATWTQEVTGSYDPNDKLVRPEGMYHFANDSILDYTIRFQNTGTDTAFTVVVVDTLSADLDVSTFRAGASSHPYTYTLNGGGLLTFTFANILLPDSNVNEAASHGLVKFTIKPHAPVEMGHAFVNRAYIYFDFNEPIITPDAVTVVGLPQGAAELDGLRPHLYPVPVRNELTVVLPDGARVLSAQVLTPDGRRMAVQPSFQGDRTVVPVAHLPAGLHFLHLMDRQGRSHVARFVKE